MAVEEPVANGHLAQFHSILHLVVTSTRGSPHDGREEFRLFIRLMLLVTTDLE